MDLFRGKLDDDLETKDLYKDSPVTDGVSPEIAKTEVIRGGAPAADAIKDIFDPTKEVMEPTTVIDNPDDFNNIVGGHVEDENIPDDNDGFEPVEKDGDGIPITEQTIEQPNNDYEEAEDEEVEEVVKDAETGEPILITGGASVPVQRVSIITTDLKFPWVIKTKHKL